jgi:6,7-dimethyl-8-ribityllumazine synthase
MATANKNLSEYSPETIPDASLLKFGIIVSEWNHEVTGAMLEAARTTLSRHGAKAENILVTYVPGSFELTFGAQLMARNRELDAIICLGCIIQGETRHFDFICQSVTQGLTQLNIDYNIPFIFGVLTTQNLQQAHDRAGGKHGNKGDEAAITAIKMAYLKHEMEK